jgi:ribosomal protein S9
MAEQELTTPETAAPEAPVGPKEKPNYIWGVGRRKSAVARVRVAPGTGKIEVNGRTLNDYFTAERDRKAIFGPLEVTSVAGKMDVFVNATGGGRRAGRTSCAPSCGCPA